MATLREYFDTDFPSVLNAASTLTLTINQGGSATAFEVRGRVHYDFDSGTKYVSYFIPTGPEAYSLCEGVAMNPQWLFDSVKGVAVRAGYPGERSEEHTSELQSPVHLVCRLLLEKKKKKKKKNKKTTII